MDKGFIVVVVLLSLSILYFLYSCLKCLFTSSRTSHSLRKFEGIGVSIREHRVVEAQSHMRNMPYFLNKDNLFIYWNCWKAEVPTETVIVFAHGLNDHSGRFEHVFKELVARGVTVYALDHQGHGRSEGDRLFVRSIDDFVDDLVFLTGKALQEHSTKNVFIMGQSFGSVLAVLASARLQTEIAGTIISAPSFYVDPKQVSPTTVAVLSRIGGCFPHLRVIDLASKTLCRDLAIVDHYANDPLVSSQKPTLGLQIEILKGMKQVEDIQETLKMPMLVFHGTNDEITKIDGSERFIKAISSDYKKLKTLDNGYHQVFHEVFETDNVVDEILTFVQEV